MGDDTGKCPPRPSGKNTFLKPSMPEPGREYKPAIYRAESNRPNVYAFSKNGGRVDKTPEICEDAFTGFGESPPYMAISETKA